MTYGWQRIHSAGEALAFGGDKDVARPLTADDLHGIAPDRWPHGAPPLLDGLLFTDGSALAVVRAGTRGKLWFGLSAPGAAP